MSTKYKISKFFALTCFTLLICSFITKKKESGIEIKKNTNKITTTGGSVIKSNAPASVSSDEMNVIYIGLENPLTIAASGIDSRNLIISVSEHLEIKNGSEPGRYLVNPKQVTAKGSDASISVYAKSGSDTVYLGNHFFRCRRIPDPILALETYQYGQSIKKENLKYLANVYVQNPDGFDYDGSYQVQKWEISIMRKEKLILNINGNGSSLPAEVQSRLAKLNIGDHIILEALLLAPDRSLRSQNIKLNIY